MEVSRVVNDIIIDAFEFAKKEKHEYITPEHLLYAATFQNELIDVVEKCNGSIENLRNNLLKYLSENIYKSDEDVQPQESYGFQQVLLISSQQVIYSQKDKISIEHILSAIYDLEEGYGAYYLQLEGIDKRELLYHLSHNTEEEYDEENENYYYSEDDSNKKSEKKKSIVTTLTTKLNDIVKEDNTDPLIGREDILSRTLQILCRRNKNNPLHVGEPGVGKTAITLGLAKLINEGKVPEKLKNAEIFSLDIGSAIAGTKYRGDFEERIKKVLDEIRSYPNPIVYIDEIHTIVGAGAMEGEH
jgi:ATP-dependent Clp protease ATP-binding subunit ClpA